MVDIDKFAENKVLKDKYGLEEPVAVIATAPIVEEAVKVVEKTEFKVVLVKASEETKEKLNAVKVVNRLLGVGLKEAMELTKNPPVILNEKASKEEAEAIRSEFAALNAVVELQ